MIISKTKLIIFSILLSIFIFNNTAWATPVDDALIKQDIIMYNINTQQKTLDRLSNEYNDALIKQEDIQCNIKNLEDQIKQTENQIQHNQLALKAQCINTYKYGNISIISVITESNNFEEFATNWDFCNKIIKKTNDTIDKNINLKQTLKEQKNSLNAQKQELEIEIQKINDAKKEAENCIKNLEDEYSQLTEEIATLLLQQQVAPMFFSLGEANDYIIGDSILDTNSLVQEIARTEDFAAYVAERDVSSNSIVERAYSMIGSPYVWGGTTSNGFDCSGFVSYCLTGEEGTRLGTTGTFIGWEQVTDPQPGDICVVHNGSSQHTGIYVGDGKMVHAATYGVGVVEGNVQDGMVYVRYN